MTVLSEIGDKTFFAAAILAMRHPRRLVLSGCLSALIVMTILSAVVGWAAPNLISRKWTHHITTVLFFGFGLWSLWDAFMENGEAEELAEVEAKLDADWKKANAGTVKESSKADEELKKERRPFLTQFFSPILLKAFSITFFGEWGDKSQLATIGLAADENPFGVVLGGIVGQALCTTAAVLGGKSLASQISEKIVALSGGVLFIVFGIQSFLSTGSQIGQVNQQISHAVILIFRLMEYNCAPEIGSELSVGVEIYSKDDGKLCDVGSSSFDNANILIYTIYFVQIS
ncbi:hypothetical protein COLO4_07883 [Corchorus olitorius]|uniref:GDT1 family protein n=1 Tax=Corchorus olitorius TaxID=93759 RepID=A0A1R3KI74_9ROSI|nr:hypothetical protein COLO4_07883 [Corchorus olitorius]